MNKKKTVQTPPVSSDGTVTTTDTGRSVLSIIRDLQAGTVTGASLGVDERRRCVEHLGVEGYSVAEIAEVLKVAERTINRDRQAIKEANSLEPAPELIGQTVGNLVKQADTAVSRLRRIARDRETPPAVKVEAERSCWLVARELVQSLQRLGYLPEAAREVHAELTHSLGEVPDLEQLRLETQRLEVIVAGAGMGDQGTEPGEPCIGGSSGDSRPAGHTGSMQAKLTQIRGAVERLALADQLHAVSEQVATTSVSEQGGLDLG